MKSVRNLYFIIILFLVGIGVSDVSAQEHEVENINNDATTHEGHSVDADWETIKCGIVANAHKNHSDGHHGEVDFDVAATAMHHISDGNIYTILEAIHIPLPMFLWHKSEGLATFMSSKFEAGHHDNGSKAYKGYVLYLGNAHKVACESFTKELVTIEGFETKAIIKDGIEKEVPMVLYEGKSYPVEPKSTLDGGYLGGGITSFYDFSITKNVLSMMLVALLLLLLFVKVAKKYSLNRGKAPSGIQNLIEVFIVFIRDQIARPFIGKGYEKYLDYLVTIFFFILGLNFWGQIPFLGGANVTGNISTTMVLAIITFILTNVYMFKNKDYVEHIFWYPGIPVVAKLILAPVEFMGLFIKPLTLMLRLAGNITAGHIAILSFLGLIFILGDSGRSMIGGVAGTTISIPLTMFMMSIEVLVAFIQAYVFTLLSALYIGSAMESHSHEAEHH